jgi:hypothetical protein
MLPGEKQPETDFSNNEMKDKWSVDCIKRETTVARMRVEDAVAVFRQEQEDTVTATNTGLMTREPKQTIGEMSIAFRDSLSNITSSDNGEGREGEDDDEREHDKLSENDEPS